MCYAISTFEGKKGKSGMETVRKKAWNPITNEEYEIELPADSIKQIALLENPFLKLITHRVGSIERK